MQLALAKLLAFAVHRSWRLTLSIGVAACESAAGASADGGGVLDAVGDDTLFDDEDLDDLPSDED